MNDAQLAHARRLHTLGVAGVLTLWLPIFFWMAHLGSTAALVEYVANHPSKWWIEWVDTGVLAAATAACIAGSALLGASVKATVRDGTAEGRTRFLAWQGVLAGLANLALILAEGSYVLFLPHAQR